MTVEPEPEWCFQSYVGTYRMVWGYLQYGDRYYEYFATWNKGQDALWDFQWSSFPANFGALAAFQSRGNFRLRSRHRRIPEMERLIPRFRERVITELLYAKVGDQIGGIGA